MSYDRFKQKLGYGARPSIYEIVITVPPVVAVKAGVSQSEITDTLKFYVSGTQVPGRTIGAISVNYQGEEVKLAGDPTYEDINYTFLNDVDYFTREIIELWCEYQVDPTNNGRANPQAYKQTCYVYQVSNEVDANGNKTRIKGWKLEGAFPSNFAAIDKGWDNKDTVETSTFTMRYDKHKRVDGNGALKL